MGIKQVSYVKLLKEAIAEFDTSKTVDMKGPMLDPIMSYDGAGELPTHKDAASILERYYFNEINVRLHDGRIMSTDYVLEKNFGIILNV